jgi:hypothetical protein
LAVELPEKNWETQAMISRRTYCLVTLAFLSLILPACYRAREKPGFIGESMFRETKTHNLVIQYGFWENGKVEYVTFSGTKKPDRPTDMVIIASAGEDIIVECSGSKVNVTDYQLFEFVDGKFRKSKGDLTEDEIRAFIESEPDSYTIDALLTFVKKRRADR